MFITKLDVVNAALATIGEAGLTDLQEDHAYRDTVLGFIDAETDRICARGWWFNQEYAVLTPDSNSGFVYVPPDVYSAVAIARRGFEVAVLGRRVYDSRNRTYVWTAPVHMRLTRKFGLDELPYHAVAAIRDSAVLLFQGNIDADRETKADWGRKAQLSWEELVRTDLQHQKHNMLLRPGMTHNAIIALDNHDYGGRIVGPNIRW